MFGQNLKYYREKAGMSQKELADKLCIAQSNIARFERGTRQPTPGMLCELSDIFGVTIDDLVKERVTA